MTVTEVRLILHDNHEDSLVAFGSITFDQDFVVNGIKLMKGRDGDLFVGYPSKQNKNGEYKDICFPMKKDLRKEINEKVIEKYHSLMEKSKTEPVGFDN